MSCDDSDMDYLQDFAVYLDLEMSMSCEWMSTNVRFVRVNSKRCKHAVGNHKPERCEGYNHIPHG